MDFEGTAALVGGQWEISGGADILFRAQRSIMNATRKDTSVLVPATDEAAVDILWFAQRFRIDIMDPMPIRSAAARFVRAQHESLRVMSRNYRPPDLKFSGDKRPRKYQSLARDLWLANRSLLLADEVGLGKTITTAAALLDRRVLPMTIVVPVHLAHQWVETLNDFVPGLKIHTIRTGKLYDAPQFRRCPRCGDWSEQRVVRGKVASESVCPRCPQRLSGPTSSADVYVSSYHKLSSWAARLGEECNSVVYDEVQELRRNKSAKWQAAMELSQRVNYRLGLSATPIYNLGGEIYNVMNCVAPGRLGSRDTFRETWCDGYVSEGKEPALKDSEAFGSYLRSQHLMLRRTREDVGRELPKHSKVIHTIEADIRELNKISGRAADLAKIILQGSTVRGEQLNAYGQLEAIVRQQTGIAKAPYVAAFVDMILQQDRPVVLFGWHRSVYDLWMDALAQYKPALYTGSETSSRKVASKNRFISGDTNLLICSLRSGAGLDGLQKRCRTVVFGELDWSPAVHHQCAGRVHRDGQDSPSISYYLVCEYLTDPMIARALGLKQAQSDAMLGSRDAIENVRDSAQHIQELAKQFAARRTG